MEAQGLFVREYRGTRYVINADERAFGWRFLRGLVRWRIGMAHAASPLLLVAMASEGAQQRVH